jgi:inner membrane protein
MTVLEQFFGLHAGWLWLILAALLAIVEIAIAPGIFFIFIAIAAAITGTITLFADIGLAMQCVLFGILSVLSVYAGRYFYARQNHVGASPNLNDRAAQMAGQMVTVTQTVTASSGRVRVGDSEWPACGADMRACSLSVGTKARIAKVVNGCVHVEAAE